MHDGAVIVALSGGVGNQLFQYSAGRAIARERQQPLQVLGRPSLGPRTLRVRDLLDIPDVDLTAHERFLTGMPETALGHLPPKLRRPVRRFARRRARYLVLRQTLLEMAETKRAIDDRYRYVHLRGFFQHSSYYEPALDPI